MKKNVRKALAISGMTLAIGASGLILDASASTARPVRVQRSHQEKILRSKSSDLHEKNRKGRKTFTGTVSEIKDNSITLLSGEKTFTAKISDETRILNKQWGTISLSELKSGDKIKIFGKSSGDIIIAKTLRIILNHTK